VHYIVVGGERQACPEHNREKINQLTIKRVKTNKLTKRIVAKLAKTTKK
jgi:hypothetical protein